MAVQIIRVTRRSPRGVTTAQPQLTVISTPVCPSCKRPPTNNFYQFKCRLACPILKPAQTSNWRFPVAKINPEMPLQGRPGPGCIIANNMPRSLPEPVLGWTHLKNMRAGCHQLACHRAGSPKTIPLGISPCLLTHGYFLCLDRVTATRPHLTPPTSII